MHNQGFTYLTDLIGTYLSTDIGWNTDSLPLLSEECREQSLRAYQEQPRDFQQLFCYNDKGMMLRLSVTVGSKHNLTA